MKASDNQHAWGIDAFTLHLLAMVFMLCDHLWATIIPGNSWLNNIGRMAFPIFAFMIAEGFFRTKSIGRYLLRMLAGALLSELPFNLMYGGTLLYPYHQNVLWTFLLALLCMLAVERLKAWKRWLFVPAVLLVFGAGALLAQLAMLDYYGFGILTVLVFYLFRKRTWLHCLLQAVGLYLVFVVLYGGMLIDVTIFGHTFEIVQEGLCLGGLLPIWLYNRRQGPHSKPIQAAFYLFYPAHMLILSLIALYLM